MYIMREDTDSATPPNISSTYFSKDYILLDIVALFDAPEPAKTSVILGTKTYTFTSSDETYKEKTLKYLQSDVNKQKVSERFKGKKLSDEHKQKMSESSKNKKQIIIDNVIYESISNASKILNINRELIKGRLRSKTYPNYSYLII